MNPKSLAFSLAAVTLVGFALYTTYAPEVEGTRPINPRACENTDYVLKFKNLDVAADIVPGRSDRMDAYFNPAEDGQISLMTLEVYKFKIKLHTIKSQTKLDFKKGELADYIYQVMLPKFIPHINVTIHMNWFDARGKLLSCVMFDLHL